MADSITPAFVYKITNLITNKIYIGITARTIHTRWKAHVYDALSGHRNFALHNAIRKYGPVNFTVELVEECSSRQLALERERYWVKTLGTLSPGGYNMTPGGEIGPIGPLRTEHKQNISRALTGRKVTDEFRARMSLIAKGRSSEHLKKISQALTGKKVPESVRAKIRAHRATQVFSRETIEKRTAKLRGRKHTDISRQHMSAAQKGRVISDSHRIKISKTLRSLSDTNAAIIKFDAWGWPSKKYAEYFQVTPQTVCCIRKGRIYKDITREHLP